MGKSLRAYRGEVLDALLDLAWRQWSALGVPGYAGPAARWVLDPEALFAFTCTIGRYDPRLFDATVAWLSGNERLFNVQRLRTLFREGLFTGVAVASAVAAKLGRGAAATKWQIPASLPETPPQPLFRLKAGTPRPLAKSSDDDFSACGFLRNPLTLERTAISLSPAAPATLLLRLRAFIGLNARCEIIVFLLTHQTGYPREIARSTHYFQKTVHDALDDMSRSGYVASLKLGRERVFSIVSMNLFDALADARMAPAWANWPALLGALEHYWLGIDMLVQRGENDPLLVASELRQRAKVLEKNMHGQQGFPVIVMPRDNTLPECLAGLHNVLETLRK